MANLCYSAMGVGTVARTSPYVSDGETKMTTKERAIAAVAALRDRPHNRYLPPALNEELVDAVLDAIRTPGPEVYALEKRRGQLIEHWQAIIDAIKNEKPCT